MDFWTLEQIENSIGIKQVFEKFCEADPKLSKLDSIYPGLRSKKFSGWAKQYRPALDAATENFVDLFRKKALIAIAWHDDKEIVLPPEYWALPLASLTLTGRIQGLPYDDPDRYLEDAPVVLLKEDWEKWLNAATPNSPSDIKPRRNRARDVAKDAVTRTKIEMVLAIARRRWPNPHKRLGIKTMAKDLVRNRRNEIVYKASTVRQILDGTYSASINLGIGRL